MERIRYRLEESGNTLEVVNLLEARRDDEVTFHFHLKHGTGPHKLSVREKGRTEPCSHLFKKCHPPHVTLSRSNRRDKIKATVNDVDDGDYLYEIVEWNGVKWVPVLDPILEIEGGRGAVPDHPRVPNIPTAAVAVGVGLLAGILTYKALK